MENITAEQIFATTGLTLPPAPSSMGVYKPHLIDGKYLYISGHAPIQPDGKLLIGRIGEDVDMEQGKLAARHVGLTMLSTIKPILEALVK